jgi:uncharacterized SAM-binding protein YcdF (DUF218 family)
MLKKLKRGLKYLLLIIIVWSFYNGISIYNYSKNYCESYSDVAIVLGAGSTNGKVSPVFRERINHAIFLYNSSKINYIIFTGGFGKNETTSDSKSAMNYAIEKGIPKEKIFIEEKSTITYHNLIMANSIMESNNFKTAVIVSDPYHMKRSLTMCSNIEINGKPSPTQTSMYQSWSTKLPYLIYETFYYNIDLVFGHLYVNLS